MLKIIRLRKELEIAQTQREELSEKDGSFSTREQELIAAINEAAEQDDVDLVRAEMDKFEQEQAEHNEDKKTLDEKIAGIEQEIEDLEENAPDNPAPAADAAAPAPERSRKTMMEVRDNMTFKLRKTRANPFGQTREERREYLANPEIKEFYERLVDFSKEKRGVNGAELGIPTLMMGYFRDSVEDYSVLLSRTAYRRLRGDGKAIIAGTVPEAVWTECCANINELTIDFSAMYIYCHKVAGYIPVCNATLEDFGGEDGIPTLAAEVEYYLLKSIGLALDKAIIYGNGTEMPLGFVRSLPMTANPVKPDEMWPSYAANVAAVSGTGATLFKNIMKLVANANDHGAQRDALFIMRKSTWLKYIAPESLAFNAAGLLVAAQNQAFPAIGGDVVFLPFIPEGDVVGGYLDNYALVERAGIKLAMSEHVMFLQDNTVFKATARYDGAPVTPFRDSFFAFNVNGGTPATTVPFAPNTANTTEEPEEPEEP